jgi:hypothetical protein
MPNPIKYNTSAETLALKKGNFWIGTGDVGKGPTLNTGFYNGLTPPTGGFTIYLNKASGGPSIYTVSTEAELTGLTNTISVSTNLIKNNNGGNFANGTVAPFNGSYGTLPTIVDITNDKPYNGSTSTKAAKFVAGGGMFISTSPSPFTMTVGVTYTFSFWYRQTNSNNFYIGFNNQGGSGDVNGNFQAYSSYGMFSNPTQTWQRCSWTFTNVVDKNAFFIYSFNSVAGSECLMTEFTLTEGSMPGGPGLTTSGNCLNWFSTQTDKMIFNRDYPAIVTSGLTLNLDAGFSPSFATIPSNINGNTIPTWYDSSSNGNNGTLTNGPTYSSVNGGGIVFDGVDDRILLSYNPIYKLFSADTVNQTWTISMWVNLQSKSSGSQSITQYFNNIGPGLYLVFPYNNNLPLMWTDGQYFLYGNTIIVDKGLTNVVFQFDGNSTRKIWNIYLNGKLDATRTLTISNANFPLLYANQTISSSGEEIKGNMYTYSVYDRVLSSSEILQNYQLMLPRFVGENIVTNGLVFYLDAGYKSSYSGSGTTWNDVSGYGNNGTLTNGPTYNSANGGSIVFDGVDDNVYIGNPSTLQFNNATFSYGCWFYWANVNTQAILMGKRDGNTSINVPTGANYNQWGMGIFETACCGPAGKNLGAYISCDGGSEASGSLIAALPNNNGWIYGFITINTTEQKLYINGVLSSTTNSNYTNKTFKIVGRSFYVGATGGQNEGSIIIPFNNKIAIAQVYNRTLSNNEVLQNYNAQKGRYGL